MQNHNQQTCVQGSGTLKPQENSSEDEDVVYTADHRNSLRRTSVIRGVVGSAEHFGLVTDEDKEKVNLSGNPSDKVVLYKTELPGIFIFLPRRNCI